MQRAWSKQTGSFQKESDSQAFCWGFFCFCFFFSCQYLEQFPMKDPLKYWKIHPDLAHITIVGWSRVEAVPWLGHARLTFQCLLSFM